MPDFAGSVSVVVGGNQGLGAAAAEALAARGSIVVLAGRNSETLAETAERISGSGGHAVTHTVDITDVESTRGLAEFVETEIGPTRLLVNAAGNTLKKPALEVTPADWDLVMNVHLRGVFFTCQAFAPPMMQRGYGKIVNLSSTWASTVAPSRSVYAAAKAAVSHLTAALAVEWASHGVRVNAVAPTATRTPRVEERQATDPSALSFSVERIPLGRIAEPSDVVAAIVFLAGTDSDFITGHTLDVDGGWRFSKL